jgi:hypothetical protein
MIVTVLRRDLGLHFRPGRDSTADTMQDLARCGHVKR